MLKIKDEVDLKELEKFGYMYWDKEGALIKYMKFLEYFHIVIYEDRRIDIQLPINSILNKKDIKIETFIDDLIQANLVEKVSDR